jgi:hypothetical protein
MHLLPHAAREAQQCCARRLHQPPPVAARLETAASQKSTAGELTAWRDPDPGLAARNLGLALFESGSHSKNWDAVSRSYEILSHLQHRDPVVLATLGSILLQQNHPGLAVTLYKQATAAEPLNARKLSEIYDQLHQYSLGKQVIADYLKFMPQNIILRRVN